MSRRTLFLVLLATCLLAKVANASDGNGSACPPVSTNSGAVQGTVQYIDRLPDKPIYTYLGIPYAAPPVGDLRYRAPQPAVPWEGARDATRPGPYCPQGPHILQLFPFKLQHYDFDEDCLTLNIETPTVDKDAELPVLLWIHGGALSMGMGYVVPFAALAARQDVVVVSINYRLGALGFLSTGDENAPGNVGFLDQIQAMIWVKENIRNFGGDPERVTIFGESAGGVSVSYQVLSPLSKGLFQRAISQSGTYNTMEPAAKPMELATMLGNEVGCEAKDAAGLVACLRQKPADDLVAGAQRMASYGSGERGAHFGPVLDGHFLPEHPTGLYENGQANAVEYLLGVNNHEFGFVMPSIMYSDFGKGMTEDAFLLEMEKLIEKIYPGTKNKDGIVAAARDVYRNHDNPDDPMAVQYQFTLFQGDQMFVAPTVDTAMKHTASGSKVYLYENYYVPSTAAGRPDWVGCDHGDDLAMMSGWPFLDVQLRAGGSIPFSQDDRKVSLDMMAYWANFARTGDPSDPTGAPADSLALPEWPRYTRDHPAYIRLGVTSSADVGLHPDRMALWNDVIPKLVASSNREEL
ncbi:PREDICTED: liver carboxylesterase-like [Branchiostoma belcheri]|uniref:Carboxylic ester hydrolase n=1 Tax=Branchiostoma belcheri TaxID=7741 RepID=A0A6P4XRR6_BRABE|nr:PREDICTED: liver carboxylesterase-like [Branchiostoma belcheri]